MADSSAPRPLSAGFADLLGSAKAGFVSATDTTTSIDQHGAATLDMDGWPGWPDGLTHAQPVIETYVATQSAVQATSDNEPFVSAWLPLVDWMNATVRAALDRHDVELDGDAYVTASLTHATLLEGTAHMDDDTFVPTESVGMVAIIGEHIGPRVATGQLSPRPLRAMSQVVWTDDQRAMFEADQIDHCACAPDQLVIFPQFGQLHAGPAAPHLARLGPAATRQLLVYRARVVTTAI